MTMTKFSRINKQREEITMRVLEDMEKGGNEWKKPWVEASPLPPHNPVSGTQYSGRNFLYTYVYGMMRGYADPRWATEKQIKEMGWKIPENLQNGRGGINDELGVGIEHWGMYAYIPRVKKDGTPLTDPEAAGYGEHVAYLEFWKGRLDSVAGTDEYEATKEELCDDFFAAASQASQATDFIIDRYEQEVGHPAAGKEIVQKLDMPEKTEQEDRAVRSLSHKKETARDASAHMQGDRADLVNMRDENAIGA